MVTAILIDSFKKLTKKKMMEYELRSLLEMKNKMSKTKMKNLEYKKLELQPYLKKFDSNFASCIFRFRVMMAPFSGNFRGPGPLKSAPSVVYTMIRKV
jgi:hypothetical protein